MRAKPSVILLAASIVASAAWFGYHTTPESGVELIFLSVGQGDCIVIRDGGQTALIDAGPSSDTFDAGERLIVPKLRKLGISRIDLVLLSHPDADHIGGLSGISNRFRIGKVLYANHFQRSAPLLDELRQAQIGASQRLAVLDGQTVHMNRIELDIFLPEWGLGSSDNEGSMFVKVVAKSGACAVFTGDAAEETELAMATRTDWKAAILKAGHHGSRFSTSYAWLNRVQPNWVVFSCGRGNMYGHPSKDALDRASSVGAQNLRTDLQGDIRFVLENEGWSLAR